MSSDTAYSGQDSSLGPPFPIWTSKYENKKYTGQWETVTAPVFSPGWRTSGFMCWTVEWIQSVSGTVWESWDPLYKSQKMSLSKIKLSDNVKHSLNCAFLISLHFCTIFLIQGLLLLIYSCHAQMPERVDIVATDTTSGSHHPYNPTVLSLFALLTPGQLRCHLENKRCYILLLSEYLHYSFLNIQF